MNQHPTELTCKFCFKKLTNINVSNTFVNFAFKKLTNLLGSFFFSVSDGKKEEMKMKEVSRDNKDKDRKSRSRSKGKG